MTDAAARSEDRTAGSGLMVRSWRAALEEQGRLAEVRARVSPEAAKLLDAPPLPMAWVPMPWFAEVVTATERVAGRAGCRRLGYVSARGTSKGVLSPLVKMSSTLFGATPPTFYGRMETLCTVLMRNVAFSFTPTGPRAGTLRVRYSAPLPEGLFVSWEGACEFIHEVCRTPGHVAPVRLEDLGQTGAIDVTW